MISYDTNREQSERLTEAIDACRSDWESSLDSDKIAEAWLAGRPRLPRLSAADPHGGNAGQHSEAAEGAPKVINFRQAVAQRSQPAAPAVPTHPA